MSMKNRINEINVETEGDKAIKEYKKTKGDKTFYRKSTYTSRISFVIAIILALLIALLAACGSQTANSTTTEPQITTETTTAATTTTTAAAATTAAATTTAPAATTATTAATTTAAATTATTAATTTAATTTAATTAAPATTETADGGGDTWERVQQEGKFILGLDDSFPPMGFRDDNNEIVGFDIDMARAAAEYLGVEVELKPVIWDTVLLSLNSGEIDCIWNGLSVTDARKREITYSKSYVNSNQIIVTLTGSDILTKADLAGAVVGTQMGSSTLDALEAEPEISNSFGELREYADFTQAMMDLDNRRLDAVVIDGIAFYGDFNVKSPGSYNVLEENFGLEEMGIGLRQTDTVWIGKINEALDYLKSSGKAAEISIKWFGADILII